MMVELIFTNELNTQDFFFTLMLQWKLIFLVIEQSFLDNHQLRDEGMNLDNVTLGCVKDSIFF